MLTFFTIHHWGGTKHSSVLGHHLRETSERLWKLMNWITKSPFTDKAAPWDQIPATGIWKFRSICEICVCVCETFRKLASERLGVSSYQHKSWKTTPMCPENMDFPSEIELFSITDFRVPRREKKKKTIVAPRRWIDQHDVNWSFGMQLRVYHNIYSIFCITNIYTHISSTDYSTTQNRFLQKKRYKRCSNLSLEKTSGLQKRFAEFHFAP